MKNEVTRTLYSYWDDLRGERPAPNRSEIDPARIRGLLGDTFILEKNDRHTYRFRLAGTRLCSVHCRELKFKQFLRGWNQEDREALETLLASVTEDGAAAVVGVEGHTERGQTLKMEMLLLPLNVPGEGRVRVLGTCVPLERPYWIGMFPILTQSISSLRLVWPDEHPYFVQPRNENVQPIFPVRRRAANTHVPQASTMHRQVRHLVVYEGGKA